MSEVQCQNRVVLGAEEHTWAELRARFSRQPSVARLTSVTCPVALVADGADAACGAVAHLAFTGIDGLLLTRERLTPAVVSLLHQNGFARLDLTSGHLDLPKSPARCEPGRICLLTSGSTGTPKLVRHRWETLFTGREMRNVPPRRWLVPYQAGTYAWYQLLTLGLFQSHQTLVVTPTDDIERVFRIAAAQRVDSLSATPTFWRLACFQVPPVLLGQVPLTTITLGGELADQPILDRLKALFPCAQITHIYASTEAGACIVVKDGRAGFPAAFLSRNQPGLPALRMQDGRLWIRSPYSTCAAAGEPDTWIDSGDLIELRGDRVHFVGRANTALINVGGNKAYPADIEAVLLSHPAVRWCRVRAVRSPLVGNLPEADVVYASECQVPDETTLTRYCSDRLPAYAVPRFWNRLEAIPVQASLKSTL